MPAVSISRYLFFVLFVGLVSPPANISAADGTPEDWREVDVPKIWEAAADNKYQRNHDFSWYRARVALPLPWKERAVQLFVESVDDAREIYWNGTKIAQLGEMPPAYRSGLGGGTRFSLTNAPLHFGGTNVIAIRVYRNDSRSGFNVAAPALFAGDQALWLKGKWEARPGDDPKWAHPAGNLGGELFSTVQEAAIVDQALQRLEKDDGPLSPATSLTRLHVEPDLRVDLILSDPDIGQPLSFKFDARGRLWVVEYLQYPIPAGLKMVSRDMYLRTVYDRVPPPPPHHFRGRDKITIHQDSDGDGKFDQHLTFVDGLNMATSFALGRGGVWVLNPPYLLFYPDRDGDDHPDGDPEVRLEGFGLEDSHALANSLRWGPDGWLYGAQGSTVSGVIKAPGAPGEPTRSLGQLIWRYHPESRRYEIFAEGGGNAFGVEIDSKGRIFSGHNGGNTRGFHYVQGAYLQKGFGKHGQLSNPYAFGYFNAMAHHEVPRFTHTFVIYDDRALPERYWGNLFGVEPLQGRVVRSEVSPDGSTFQTRDLGHPLTSDDSWFRPVDIQLGPDGAVYVADFYEQRIDHASHYQGRVDPGSGRIYRLAAAGLSPGGKAIDLARLSSSDLVSLLRHDHRWFRQTALRLLADRRDADIVPALKKFLRENQGQTALEALWALYVSGGASDTILAETLDHPDPYVRGWAVRLLCDDKDVDSAATDRLIRLAATEPAVIVRSQLASSAGRLSPPASLGILRSLVVHTEDSQDPRMPLLLWWALETNVGRAQDDVLAFAREPAVWNSTLFQEHLATRLMRRFAASGQRRDLLACVQLLQMADGEARKRTLLKGLQQAFEGRPMTGLPEELSNAIASASGSSQVLQARQGSPAALTEAVSTIANDRAEVTERSQLIEVLGQLRYEPAVPALLKLVQSSRDDSLRKAALAALGRFDKPEIGAEVIRLHNGLPEPLRDAAAAVLVSRKLWAQAFLAAVETNAIDAAKVSAANVRQLSLFAEPKLNERVARRWPQLEQGTATATGQEVERVLRLSEIGSGNPYQGRTQYRTLCAGCHTLFGEGGNVGPDLTSYQRSDPRALVVNVIQPSLQIREGFENFMVTTKDDRLITGFLVEQDSSQVSLRGVDGLNTVVPRNEVESLRALTSSLMPEGLLSPLSDQELRDLLAYLRSSQPLP